MIFKPRVLFSTRTSTVGESAFCGRMMRPDAQITTPRSNPRQAKTIRLLLKGERFIVMYSLLEEGVPGGRPLGRFGLRVKAGLPISSDISKEADECQHTMPFTRPESM